MPRTPTGIYIMLLGSNYEPYGKAQYSFLPDVSARNSLVLYPVPITISRPMPGQWGLHMGSRFALATSTGNQVIIRSMKGLAIQVCRSFPHGRLTWASAFYDDEVLKTKLVPQTSRLLMEWELCQTQEAGL